MNTFYTYSGNLLFCLLMLLTLNRHSGILYPAVAGEKGSHRFAARRATVENQFSQQIQPAEPCSVSTGDDPHGQAVIAIHHDAGIYNRLAELRAAEPGEALPFPLKHRIHFPEPAADQHSPPPKS